MIKRYKFYDIAKQKIDQIIKRGRDIASDLEKIKTLKDELRNIASFNYNKQCFYIGLLDLINHNLEYIQSSQDINIMKRKLSLKLVKNENFLEEIIIPKKQITNQESYFNKKVVLKDDDIPKLSEEIELNKESAKRKKAQIRSTIQLLKLEQLKDFQDFDLCSSPKLINSKTLNLRVGKISEATLKNSPDRNFASDNNQVSDDNEEGNAEPIAKVSYINKLTNAHQLTNSNLNLNGYQAFIRKLSRMNLAKLRKRNSSIENKAPKLSLDPKLIKIPSTEKIDEVSEEEIQANYDRRSSGTILSTQNPKVELHINNMVKELKAIKIQNIDIQKCLLNLIKILNAKESEFESSYSESIYSDHKNLAKIPPIRTKIFQNEHKDSENSMKVSEELLNELNGFKIGI